jgi:hypothetical protein
MLEKNDFVTKGRNALAVHKILELVAVLSL